MSDEIREHESGHSNKLKPIIILKTHITKNLWKPKIHTADGSRYRQPLNLRSHQLTTVPSDNQLGIMTDKVTTTLYIYTLMLSNNHGLFGDYYLIQISEVKVNI